MLYIIEAYNQYSKIQTTENHYSNVKKRIDEYSSMGYTVSVTPKDMTLDEYALATTEAMKQFFMENLEVEGIEC